MGSELRVAIVGPGHPTDLATPYAVTVGCEHGRVQLVWQRVCRHGCHLRGADRAAGCRQVSPSAVLLREVAIRRHERRYGCACAESYWMRAGPRHPLGAHLGIQASERRLVLGDAGWLGLPEPFVRVVGPWGPGC